MLGPVEVAGRDDRQPCARDPGEEVVAVADLEAVDGLGRPLGLLGVAGRRARRAAELAERVRVRADQRCAVRAGPRKHGVEPGIQVDVLAEPDGDRVGGQPRVGIVEGQLARDQQQVVERARPLRLDLDLGEVGGMVGAP